MGTRLELQSLLESILGSKAVYFQPPQKTQIEYPCIIYQNNFIESVFADNNSYLHHKRYSVTVIDRNPDSNIPAKILALPMCTVDRFYVRDGLNHYTFTLYF